MDDPITDGKNRICYGEQMFFLCLLFFSGFAQTLGMKTASTTFVTLNSGQVLSLHDGQGKGICCQEGQVWLTITGDHRDIILQSGDSLTVLTSGQVVIEAMSDSRILLGG